MRNRSAPPQTIVPVLTYRDVRSAVDRLAYGERFAVVADPDGHRWELTRSVRDVAPEEWGGTTVGGW